MTSAALFASPGAFFGLIFVLGAMAGVVWLVRRQMRKDGDSLPTRIDLD